MGEGRNLTLKDRGGNREGKGEQETTGFGASRVSGREGKRSLTYVARKERPMVAAPGRKQPTSVAHEAPPLGPMVRIPAGLIPWRL